MSTPKSKTKASPKRKPRKKSKTQQVAPSKNIEIIITLFLFFGFIIYGAGQCNKAKVAKDVAQNPEKNELTEVSFKSEQPTTTLPQLGNEVANQLVNLQTEPQVKSPDLQPINLPKLEQKAAINNVENPVTVLDSSTKNGVSTPRTTSMDTLNNYNRLWVTIDQLKVRNNPNLKSEVIMKLSLFDRVFYLNQKTPFKQEINLGHELVNEPWLLIQHSNGKKGWAYGAGLNFHKQKRKGVSE